MCIRDSLRLERVGEQLPDRVPEADVGRRARARRLADRRLVDLEDAVDRLPAVDAVAALPARLAVAGVDELQVGEQHVARERALAAAGDAGDGDEALEGDGDV